MLRRNKSFTIILASFWIWVYSKRKEFVPLGSKFFSFRVDPFSEGIGVLRAYWKSQKLRRLLYKMTEKPLGRIGPLWPAVQVDINSRAYGTNSVSFADWCKKAQGSYFISGSLWLVNNKDELKHSNLKKKKICVISWLFQITKVSVCVCWSQMKKWWNFKISVF